MWGETPVGSPEGDFPVTKRKLPMFIAARSTPVGASSDTTSRGMRDVSRNSEGIQLILKAAGRHANFCVAEAPGWRRSSRLTMPVLLKEGIVRLPDVAHPYPPGRN